MNYRESMAQRTITNPAAPQIKPAGLRTFHARLCAWYKAHGRHTLPWRITANPYAIWISEVMLQQTQVSTVLARFYHPFLEKFPTIEALANAPQEAVLKAWEGLGYYSRARNLHKAAIAVAEAAKAKRRNRAALPDTVEGLLALPGIGRNTAHAILSFGHHQPVAILEANVKRVVARIFALETPSDAQLWEAAETLLNKGEAFDYNQAMMDIGATICTPRAPKCGECPANTICQGQSSPEKYPTKKQKKAVPTRHVSITVLEDERGRLHLTNRGEKLLGGLWGFPQESDPSTTGTALGSVTHVYSHFKLIANVRHTRLGKQKNGQSPWFSREEITALPLSKLDHKVLALLDAAAGKLRHTHHSLQKKPAKPRKTGTSH